MLRAYIKETQVDINASGEIETILTDLVKLNYSIYTQMFKDSGMPLEYYAKIIEKLIVKFPEYFKQTKTEETINAILDRENLGELQ